MQNTIEIYEDPAGSLMLVVRGATFGIITFHSRQCFFDFVNSCREFIGKIQTPIPEVFLDAFKEEL